MSRDKILNSIRDFKPQLFPLPKLESTLETEIHPIERFKERLAAGGGECHLLEDQAEVGPTIKSLFPLEKVIYSNIENTGLETIAHDTIKSPHDLNIVDLAVIQGDFGVAENGAVWIDDQSLEYRAVCFIAQHLVLV
ncbi:MAG: hypothetical protein HQ517_17675, partial [SAR324 cluster bacterium]|nr:hypothetical protein [SAR324 cluster bacterium]